MLKTLGNNTVNQLYTNKNQNKPPLGRREWHQQRQHSGTVTKLQQSGQLTRRTHTDSSGTLSPTGQARLPLLLRRKLRHKRARTYFPKVTQRPKGSWTPAHNGSAKKDKNSRGGWCCENLKTKQVHRPTDRESPLSTHRTKHNHREIRGRLGSLGKSTETLVFIHPLYVISGTARRKKP